MDPVEIPPGHEQGGHEPGATFVVIAEGNEGGDGIGRSVVASGGGGDEAPIAGEGEGNEPPAACAAGKLFAAGAEVVSIIGAGARAATARARTAATYAARCFGASAVGFTDRGAAAVTPCRYPGSTGKGTLMSRSDVRVETGA